jgi:hypothetical protein
VSAGPLTARYWADQCHMVDMGAPDYFEFYSARPERLFAEAPPLDLAALGAALAGELSASDIAELEARGVIW